MPTDVVPCPGCKTQAPDSPCVVQILTNISVVRLKKGGQKFEIAAYPNMVSAWRKGE